MFVASVSEGNAALKSGNILDKISEPNRTNLDSILIIIQKALRLDKNAKKTFGEESNLGQFFRALHYSLTTKIPKDKIALIKLWFDVAISIISGSPDLRDLFWQKFKSLASNHFELLNLQEEREAFCLGILAAAVELSEPADIFYRDYNEIELNVHSADAIILVFSSLEDQDLKMDIFTLSVLEFLAFLVDRRANRVVLSSSGLLLRLLKWTQKLNINLHFFDSFQNVDGNIEVRISNSISQLLRRISNTGISEYELRFMIDVLGKKEEKHKMFF
jgi:hypothetical protein